MRILLSVVGCLVFALPSVAQSTELSRFQVFAGAAENEHLSGLGIARDYGRILRQPAECPDFSSKGVLKIEAYKLLPDLVKQEPRSIFKSSFPSRSPFWKYKRVAGIPFSPRGYRKGSRTGSLEAVVSVRGDASSLLRRSGLRFGTGLAPIVPRLSAPSNILQFIHGSDHLNGIDSSSPIPVSKSNNFSYHEQCKAETSEIDNPQDIAFFFPSRIDN